MNTGHRAAPGLPVLDELAAVGPFFEVREPAAERTAGYPVRPFAAVLAPRALVGRVERTRIALGAEPPLGRRIAASIALQAMAAKVLSGPLAALALRGAVLDVRPETLWWSTTPAGDVIALDPLRITIADRPDARLLDPVVEQVLAPLVDAVRARFTVSAAVLWGNVASSVAGAKRVLDIQRPDAAGPVATVAAGLLDHPWLAATGERNPPDLPDRGWTFRRRSCCLYYRVPGGSVCADCVLQDPPPPERRARAGGGGADAGPGHAAAASSSSRSTRRCGSAAPAGRPNRA